MLNSTTLEVAIGMALVYLLLSFLCTSINEAIAGLIGARARNLEAGVRSLLSEGMLTEAGAGNKAITLTEAVYNHGLVQSLYQSGAGKGVTEWYGTASGAVRWWYRGKKLPAYIPSRIFAAAVFDLVFPEVQAVAEKAREDANTEAASGAQTPRDLATRTALLVRAAQRAHMLDALARLPDSCAKEALLALVKQAEGDLARVRTALERWYDDGMDRVSGWYKHRTQVVLFVLGLLVSVGLNVDSIAVGRSLWNTPAVRSYTVAQAEKFAQPAATANTAEAEENVKKLEELTIPIGWNKPLRSTANWGRSQAQSMLGWLLTAFAVMLGAPFWFDLLNRFMVVRSTVKPQEKSGVEAPKDPPA